MPKRGSSLPLPRLLNGVNRYVQDADGDACVSALNVWERKGDLVRRPAFAPVAHAPAFVLPAGAARTFRGNGTVTTFDRDFGGLSGSLGNESIWFGCESIFDGILVPPFATDPFDTLTSNYRIALRYWNGTELVPIYGILDTTRAKVTVGNDQFEAPFRQAGTIVFNRDALSDWVAEALFSETVARYWVTLDVTYELPEPGATPLQRTIAFDGAKVGTRAFDDPGMRAVRLNRVNGLFPTRGRGRTSALVVGADDEVKNGFVSGAGLGFVTTSDAACETARSIDDEGSGIAGEVSSPQWTGGTYTEGLAGTLSGIEKGDQSYAWVEDLGPGVDEFQGSVLLEGQGDGTAGTSVDGLRTLNVASGWEGDFNRDDFVGLRLWVTSNPAPGGWQLATRYIVWEIVRCEETAIYLYGPTGLNSSGNEIFEIRRLPSFLRIDDAKPDFEVYRNALNEAFTFNDLDFSAAPFATKDTPNEFVYWELFREFWWVYPGGRRWVHLYDPTTGRAILTNGRCPLIEFDGRRFKQLEALWNEEDGVPGASLVSFWRGRLRENPDAKTEDAASEAGMQVFREPPYGDFICDYNSRIVVARENTLWWSAPGAYNAIWPLTYKAIIRDSENGPITGLATVNDKLAVFTPSSIHIGGPANEYGEINFRPAIQGIGFLSQAGVASATYNSQAMLLGVTVDGIKAFNGETISDVTDSWGQLIENGVNINKLTDAVVAMWRQEALFVACVPSAGSAINDRVILVDLAARRTWVWTAPVLYYDADDVPHYDGISSVVSDIDESGREFLLFGHESGLVTSLFDSEHDGPGTEVRWHARSKHIDFAGKTGACQAMLLRLEARGSEKAVEVKALVDRNEIPAHELEVNLEGATGDSEFDTATYGSGSQLASEMVRTYRANFRAGVVRGEGFAFELSGTSRFRYCGAELLLSPKGYRGH